jgi:transcriptional regulator with XRE-family HTH domain
MRAMTDTPHREPADDEADAAHPRVSQLRQTLARRLRTHRMHQHMTASALAQAVGISKAMLSKIESAERMPSVPVLLLLAEALGIELPYLFGGPAASMEPELVSSGQEPVLPAGDLHDGVQITVLGTMDLPGLQIRLLRMRATPGGPFPKPVQFDGFWIDHVISGELVMQIGERRYHLRPGDSLTYRGEVPHEVVELPAGPLEVLAVEGWLTAAGMNPVKAAGKVAGQQLGRLTRGIP